MTPTQSLGPISLHSGAAEINVFCFKSTSCLLAQMMEDTRSDFTMTFRQLSELSAQQLRNQNFEQVELIRFNSFSSFLSG